MKKLQILLFILTIIIFQSCSTQNDNNNMKAEMKILFLHHSTGSGVWKGNVNKYVYKLTKKSPVKSLIKSHNKKSGKNYSIKEQDFPKSEPYGWKNYPYDYYNIWVKNAGEKPFMGEATLEMLTKEYDVIVFKHCYPVSAIEVDQDTNDINSEVRTIGNYKLQYEALKKKLHEFPENKFLIWTGAALVKEKTNEEQAKRAKEFFTWVKEDWNEEGDNIFLWDFQEIETEGGLYLKNEFAVSPTNSHPNKEFNVKASKLFVDRLIDVIEDDGKTTNLKGEKI